MKIIYLILLCLSLNVFAQDYTQEIVITGSRITDYEEMPSVTVSKNADFLVQEIRLINDSRSPDLRKNEIIETINNLIKSSKKRQGIEISYGEGFLIPINLNDDSLQLIESNKRVDTNYIDIFVKVALDSQQSSKDQIAELRHFIATSKPVSRTEMETRGDIGLSIVNPEQYRYDILKKISLENQKIKAVVGGDCDIKIMGLENRVTWERSGVAELTLYIPYETDLTCR